MKAIKDYYDFRLEELKKSNYDLLFYHLGACECLLDVMFFEEIIDEKTRIEESEKLSKLFDEVSMTSERA